MTAASHRHRTPELFGMDNAVATPIHGAVDRQR
jgi:hypothetical protein